ncbi:unnamed protein product [Parajaminaea phylloscopi]
MRTPYLSGLAAALAIATAAPSAWAAPAAVPHPFVPGQTLATYAQQVPQVAPLHTQSTHPAVKDSYMVVLKQGVSTTDFLAHRALIAAAQLSANAATLSTADDADGIGHVYDLAAHLQGYAGKFSRDVVDYIRSLPEVDFVEQDSVVNTLEMPHNDDMVWDAGYAASTAGNAAFAAFADQPDQEVEKGAPWGLARVSHRNELSLGTYSQYLYDRHAGEGVTAYIIDTGININHVEFEGRARWGKTMPADSTDKDGNGHGTHCAGTVASKKYGVAKHAEVVAVKVLSDSGSGSMSDVTGGVLWAVEDAKKQSAEFAADPTSAKAKKHRGYVANMSLGGGKSPTLDRAVNGATAAGLAFAVAAGNENQDACNVSPAGAEGPVTVGASTIQDERAYFSNKGKCVDTFAPGLNILSTWNTGNTSTNTISGTSMASPHVCGILAYYLSLIDGDSHGAAAASSTMSFAHASANTLLRFLPLQESLGYYVFQTAQWLLGGARDNEVAYVAGLPIRSVSTPDDLKKLVVKVSTRGALKGLDKDTVNSLVFNNATTTK